MIDAHVHYQQIEGLVGPGGWRDFLHAGGIRGAVVNGTSPDDWPVVASLAKEPCLMPSFGVHPWKVDTSGQLDSVLPELSRFINAHSGRVGLGEIGLDRWKDPEGIPTQLPWFLEQWRLGCALELPISVHCLRAWGDLSKALIAEPMPARGFYLHAFGGSAEEADYWLKKGAYFGFSSAFAGSKYARHREVFRHLPLNCILIETDAPAMAPEETRREFHLPPQTDPNALNHPYHLNQAAQTLAIIKNLPPQAVVDQCRHNSEIFFGPSFDRP
jgi:TatD DNase family protein